MKQATPGDEFLWHRIHRVIEGLPPQLMTFSGSHFGKEAFQEAWQNFMPRKGEPFTPDTPHIMIFMPWFFYNWLPDTSTTSVKREALDGRTLAQAYLKKKAWQLDPLLIRYIEQCCAAPFSFYDVLSVQPGTGFVLRDIITGEEVDVTEHTASLHAQVGDILFVLVVKIDSVAMLEACSSVIFPPVEKGAILDLRNKIKDRGLPLTAELLKEYIFEMLEIYHIIADRLLNPVMPQLYNTDDEPMVFNKLIYDLACTPRAAFVALRQLNLSEDDESIFNAAEFNAAGELHKIEFAWEKPGNKMQKNWNNTVLGHIRIEGKKLTAEVNSEVRANKFRKIMTELLPDKASYKSTVIESPQAMLARSKTRGETARSRKIQQQQDELNSLPEVQAQIAEFVRQHYRKWPKEKLPALKGLTPLQAVNTSDGREMVEALLVDFERNGKNTNPPFDPAIITELREILGLT